MRVGVLARYCGGTALAFLATEAAYAAGDCAGLKAEAPPMPRSRLWRSNPPDPS